MPRRKTHLTSRKGRDSRGRVGKNKRTAEQDKTSDPDMVDTLVKNHITALNFRMENFTFMVQKVKQKLFNCANRIDSLKCQHCTNFETHKLVNLIHHFKTGHALEETEEKHYGCETCIFQSHSNFLFLRHKMFNQCGRKEKPISETAESTKSDKIDWFKCVRCPYKNKRIRCLKLHVENKHGNEVKIKSAYCPYETTFKNSMKNHVVLKHTDPEVIDWFPCELCSYKTKTKENLKLHVDTKHNKEECGKCQDDTRTETHLKMHDLRKCTNSNRIDVFCENDEIERHKAKKRKNHIPSKETESESHSSSFECEKCSFQSRLRSSLNKHILRKHADPDKIRWFRCELCSYKARIKYDLKQHNFKHNERKRFKCENCPQETNTKRDLEIHITRKHTDPNQIELLECEYCSYKAKIKKDLTQHLHNTHKEKTFKCENCTFETNYLQDLENHVISKHPDSDKIEWFRCEFCSFTTKIKKTFTRHLNHMHIRKT